MTAPVIHLDSRRPKVLERHCGCRPGRQCYPHRLDTLAAQLRMSLAEQEGELLIAVPRHESVITDVLAVIEAITDECLSAEGRGAK